MNWILPDPDPFGLPLAPWAIQALLLLTFTLHVIVMNVVVAGGPVALWAIWRGRSAKLRGTARAGQYHALAAGLAGLQPVAVAFTITTGVAPLLFVQVLYGQLFYTSSVLMAWIWLSVVPLLVVGYYACYGLSFSMNGQDARLARWLALGASLAFVLVAFIYTNNMTLMLQPARFRGLYLASDAGLHANLADWTLWPRFLHVVVGASAVTGVVVAWFGRARSRLDAVTGAWLARFGMRLFGLATLVQLAVGAWFVLAQPEPVRRVLLGGGPDSMLLAVGIILALMAIPLVRLNMFLGAVALVVVIADMVVVRHRVRTLTLAPYFQLDTLAVNPQTGVFLLFVVLLVAGLLTVAWMVRKLAAGGRTATSGVGR